MGHLGTFSPVSQGTMDPDGDDGHIQGNDISEFGGVERDCWAFVEVNPLLRNVLVINKMTRELPLRLESQTSSLLV